ncbi:helix-hairpin-helix domain-containing protein [Haloferax sp. YSMS24]|uniref:helix-hairpin-helix domain-containing protein n=1 Tax=Haloferax sp. YSMS24 TaxID=3388425 RepID=UPI00398D64AF
MTGENDTGARDGANEGEAHPTDTDEPGKEHATDTDEPDEEYLTETDEQDGNHPKDTDEAIDHILKPHAESETDPVPEELQDLKFIGPATEESLAAADIEVESIVDGDVCYRDLVQAGVNPGVAAKIRRWHSLAWSFNSGDDLDRRSTQVRGLGDDERAWVKASSSGWGDDDDTQSGDWTPSGESSATTNDGPSRDGDWTPSGSTANDDTSRTTGSPGPSSGDWSPRRTDGTTADGSGDAVAAEAAWRERSKPTPLTTLDGIDEEDAELLAEAGVRSVRRLATSDPEHVADALEADEATIREWKAQAQDATK